METLVIVLMLLVGLTFLLKLTWHGVAGTALLSCLVALFIVLTYGYAADQSRTQIAGWLMRPDLMLDMSVLLTVDVACQIMFCVLMTRRDSCVRFSRFQSVMLAFSLWFPGLMIFPVLFAMLVEVIFALPGVDFAVSGWVTAGLVVIAMPLLSFLLKRLLPRQDMRLEMLFLVSLLIICLGVVATVNGRTAYAGTENADWRALGAVTALTLLLAVAGLVINRILTNKQLSKLQ